jgi:aryl-alcohol dehydrogenase-like predicted oxidoreductase
MRYRDFPNTTVTLSEVGFGLWTTGTDWWGTMTDDDAVALIREAFELGITFFDAADTYGNGRSEEQLATALGALATRSSTRRSSVTTSIRTEQTVQGSTRSQRTSRRTSFGSRSSNRCGVCEPTSSISTRSTTPR